MIAALRQFRRAPWRILASVAALTLAVAAIGVLAIPTVAAGSLRDAARRDGLPAIVLDTADTGSSAPVAAVTHLVEQIDGIDLAEPQVLTAVETPAGAVVDLVGLPFDTLATPQRLDILRLEDGRLPGSPGDVVVTDGIAAVGDRVDVTVAGGVLMELTVVGVGSTSSWADGAVVYTTLETAREAAGLGGINRIVAASGVTDVAELRGIADNARRVLAGAGVPLTDLPAVTPAGEHPIEADIEQVSRMIGFLGVVAGLVALVLLGSTTATLVTERSREVATMRALGASPRAVRRRLRRAAIAIAVAGVVLGVPLGVVVANVIARLVLQEFVGITPGLAASIPVIVGSAVFAVVGARLVAARAARRVSSQPLAEALRDRNGVPFGRRSTERIAARVQLGNLLDRVAMRDSLHHRVGSLAMVAQAAAAVAALMIIASMATTINDFNEAEYSSWNWTTATRVVGTGLDIPAAVASADPRSEVVVSTAGEFGGWELDVRGIDADTVMLDRTVDAGRWLVGGDDVVVTSGLAEHAGVAIGDTMTVQLATGSYDFDVVGIHGERNRGLFLPRETLAGVLGTPGAGNILLSLDDEPATQIAGLATVERLADLDADDGGRRAILLIFGAIGVVVVGVAGLAVASGLAVNVHDRRHEFAVLRAIGSRRQDLLRTVVVQIVPLALTGLGLGLGLGYLGGREIARSFERADAVEIGFVFATGALPLVATVTVLGSVLLGVTVVRRVGRQSIADTLRSAA